ncbi:MAG TPA: alpha/beta fold hydrolase [Nevskiaceae bacterium]|nr:alpha/beta fold hydrolase [Nevskiaceae bacterium]
MKLHDVAFPGHDGIRLAGRLNLPDEAPRAWALFAHCFTCGKDVLAATRVASGLARRGIAVLRFDFAGLGASAGEFAATNFTTDVEDLVCAADFLRANGHAPSLLIGHSFGGAAALAAASRIPEVKALVTLAAPCDAAHVLGVLGVAIAPLNAGVEAVDVELYGRHFTITRQFVDDVRRVRLRRYIAGLKCALLVLHSPQDELVDPDNARQIYMAAPQPKSFVALDGADHLLTQRADAEYVAQIVASWSARYLPAAVEAPLGDSEDADVVRVAESGGPHWACEIHSGSHQLVADEPPAAGGGDRGPAPPKYLLAGLGACTAMTIRMLAEHRGYALEGVNVTLRMQTERRGDVNETHIQRDIELLGTLTDEQRAYLLQIANRCPVHRMLTGAIEVTTTLQPRSALLG